MALIEQLVAHAKGKQQLRRSKNKRAAAGGAPPQANLQASVCRSGCSRARFPASVYPQIWEDRLVDLEALSPLRKANTWVAIASGGCNVLSYLTAAPIQNHGHRPQSGAHRAEQAEARGHPAPWTTARSTGSLPKPMRARTCKPTRTISGHISTRRRDAIGKRAICSVVGGLAISVTNLYRHGLLGTFIGASHLLARMHGRNPRKILAAKSLEEQRKVFESELAPLFEKRHIRWLLDQPSALLGSAFRHRSSKP